MSGGDHVVPIGRLIEEMEAKLRSSLDDVYFKKTREVVEHLRSSDNAMRVDTRQSLMAGRGAAPPPLSTSTFKPEPFLSLIHLETETTKRIS